MSLHRRGGSGGGRRNHAIAGALLAAFAGACAAPPSERAQTASRAEAQEEPQPGAGLSAAMLYDILLARIAVQRGRNRIAMDAYMRAAQRSQRRDLAEKALLLAMRLNAHPRVVELSAMLGKMGAPDNSLRLPSPKSESETDKETAALHLLVEIARSFPRDEKVMREVAATLIQQSRRPGRANTLPRFRAAAAAWPNSAALHLVTALLARDMKEDDTAAESIDAALQFRPGWQSAAIFKLTHLANTSISAMRDFAEEFLRAHPQAARARIQYGKLLLRSERAKQSLAQFEKVLAQQPDSPDALLSAGIAHAKLKNPDQALLQLRKFLKAHPQHDQARLHIAAAETARNNFAAAADTLHEISAPQHALDAQLQLAAVTAARDGIEAGIEHLLQLQPRDAAERVRIVLEQDSLFRKYGMPARALQAFNHALEETPQQEDLLYHRGLLSAQLNLLPFHERDMRAVLALQPHNAHAYNALGYTLADRAERLGEARALIARALELLPNDPFILDSMGWVQFRLGHHDSAIAYLRRALDMRQDAETAAHLGEVLWAAGKRREAREIWKRGREWAPDNKTLQDTIERLWQGAALRPPRARAMAASAAAQRQRAR